MKKTLLIGLLILFLISPVLAIDLQVEKLSEGEVLIIDAGKPVVFDLNIKNLGESDSFSFYNLIGFEIFPAGTIPINKGENKNVKLELVPLRDITERGFYTFNYFIKSSSNGSQQEEKLTFKILEMKDVFEVGSDQIDVNSSSIRIFIKNKENFDFGSINVKFSSAFFDKKEVFEMGPKEKKEFGVQLNKEDFAELMAGFYTLNAEIKFGDEKANVEGIIKFTEKDLIITTKKDFGFLINTQIIEKKNDGNTLILSETVIKKNIVSRLFTTLNPEPDIVEREGNKIYYTWNHEISPGETAQVKVKTNWLFPLLVILFIVAIVILTKKYTGTNMVLKKRVSFVRAKGGEFALKVSIFVNAKKYIERVNIIDRLPPLVKIYDRFGGEKPTRIDEKTRRLEWNFEKLEAGEIRVLSYIIYSKVGIMGRFALPTATAIFEREGVIHEKESNKAFFMNEPHPTKKNEDEGI